MAICENGESLGLVFNGAVSVVVDQNQRAGLPAWLFEQYDVSAFTSASRAASLDAGFAGIA